MSGYSGCHRDDSSDIAKMLRDTKAKTRDESYDAGVNQILNEFLKKINAFDSDDMRKILNAVKQELADAIDGSVDIIYGGSTSRHTYLEGLSDIDTLMIIKTDNSGEKSPNYIKSLFADRLKNVFGKESVSVGNLAVTLIYHNKEIQILPAMRDGDKYRISSPDGKSWSKINPRAFAEKLTQANKAQNGNVIPTIKIAKAIIASFPKQQQMTGYHIESLAVESFKNYKGQKTYKDMVTHLFDRSAVLVMTPIKDRSGQSVHVDEYLGADKSSKRRIISQALQGVQRKIKNADAWKSQTIWNDLVNSR